MSCLHRNSTPNDQWSVYIHITYSTFINWIRWPHRHVNKYMSSVVVSCPLLPSTKVQTKAFLSAPADKSLLVFLPQSKLSTLSVCSLSVWTSVQGSLLSVERVRIWISRELSEMAMLLPSGLQAWHVIGSTPKLNVSVILGRRRAVWEKEETRSLSQSSQSR